MKATSFLSLVTVAAVIVLSRATTHTQDRMEPVNNLPNPYLAIDNFFQLAEGRWWDSASGVDIDIDGSSIWIADRCDENNCANARLNPILKFNDAGILVKRFGEGMFIVPHGIHVDREGNIWVTDAQGPNGRDAARNGKGHAVYKFSPDGTVLLTLGKPGVAGNGTGGALLYGPSDVVTAPNGDIFVADGHDWAGAEAPAAAARIVKFTKAGTFVNSWGTKGSGQGEFRTPHGLAFDSQGRLFVADRDNNRIQIFDRDGQFLEAWRQFGRPSGIYIDKNDVLYCADSESGDLTNPGWKRGIRIGNARTGAVSAFIPDRDVAPKTTGRSSAEGVAVDALGTVYSVAVDAGAQAVKKYVKQ